MENIRENIMEEELRMYLIETGVATEAEIALVSEINGYRIETLESILYVRTGYRSLDQVD